MAVVKGGVWTNVEDEILKAAISKYGKNQWARISSLLVRKTPKQCKARWYEWLDPGIKKLDWTRDEDEKLLHLAKLLPTQWRTIAPIVGRTSTQCLERYQKLLDDAEAAENNELGLSGAGAEGSAPTADSVRRLRAGETDPDPETKPAKPDAIDMDEDEKEMLSEARARLANTQGKKAKRKQREKLLAETKRLSVIQKRRDLKAAGINIKLHHRRKGEMDYNADIPFEHKPALGFYDTTEEAEINEKERKAVDFRQVEQRRREEDQGKEERKNMKKRENDTTIDSASQAASLEKLRKAEQLSKRRKLNLPGPQVSDQELEELVKIGYTSAEAKDLAEASDHTASQGLLGEYSSVGSTHPVRTPRTPAAQDSINLEARNLRAMTNTQSSLLGAENTPLHGAQQGSGYGSATPRSGAAATPHPLERREVPDKSQIQNSGRTPMRTPLRDNLLLNTNSEENTGRELVYKSEERAAEHRAAKLRSQFASLPAPKNDFELELLEDEPEDEGIDLSNDVIEDSAERDAREQRTREAHEAISLQQRSQVLQRGLPRPTEIDLRRLTDRDDISSEADRLIAQEMVALILSDAAKFPLPSTIAGAPGKILQDIDLATLKRIRAEILAEAGDLPMKADLAMPDLRTTNCIPGMEHYYEDEGAEITTLTRILPSFHVKIESEAAKAAKLEKKLSLVLGGYQKRASMLSQKLREAGTALQEAHIELVIFETLKDNEEAAILTRTEVLQEEVKQLEAKQSSGQELYALLSNRKEDFFQTSHI